MEAQHQQGLQPPQTGGTSSLAISSFVLGILSCGFSCLTGIPGLILGLIGLSNIRESERRGDQPPLQGRGLAIAGVVLSSVMSVLSVIGVLVGLLLPAVQQAREAARRSSCSNNLKQIGLAMHNYADANRAFPTDICDRNGRPLLSWRVAILPYLEGSNLHEQFHLDEPWDSPHNLSLIKKIPAAYSCPSSTLSADEGRTTYVGVKGSGYFLDTGEPPAERELRDFHDGLSRTVMVVELPQEFAVAWTRPDPVMPGPEVWLEASMHHAGGLFGGLMADGSVRFLSSTIAPDLLRAFFTISGGEDTQID